jgi:predicted RNA-binding Zn-ribbon protein involved in translation (DUF1610 family)
MTPRQLLRDQFGVSGFDLVTKRRIEDLLHTEGLICRPSLRSDAILARGTKVTIKRGDVPTPDELEAMTKTCPKCGEDVKSDAVRCRHCGHRFGRRWRGR